MKVFNRHSNRLPRMANSYFRFKQFTVHQGQSAMKVTTDSCLFGAWVANRVQHFGPGNKSLLDIGTGTGILSLMVAQKNDLVIDSVEIEPLAAAQATANIEASLWKKIITVQQVDVLQWTPGKKWDYIMANPPFYETDLKSNVEAKNKAHHGDGLQLLPLLHFIKSHLADNGYFFMLLPVKREADVEKIGKELRFFLHQKIRVQPTTAHPPFRLLLQGAFAPVEKPEELTIAIKNSTGHYTTDFSQLLKDYYLNL